MHSHDVFHFLEKEKVPASPLLGEIHYSDDEQRLDWLTPKAYKLEPKMTPQLNLIDKTTEPRLIWIVNAKKLLVFLSKLDVSIYCK